MKNMKFCKFICIACILVLLPNACAPVKKAKLDPNEMDFLAVVQHIISKQEKKRFKGLPPQERERFIEDFWRVRDPDLSTPENEFKDEYFRRIDRANYFFHGSGPGWLSDRGRIMILLGEPERRDVYPSGYSFYEPPVEIWYYGFFPIVFIDANRDGTYMLENTSAQKLTMINNAQKNLKPDGLDLKANDFDFKLDLSSSNDGISLRLEIPYLFLALKQVDKSNNYETQLKTKITVTDEQGKTVLEKEDTHHLSLTADQLLLATKSYHLVVPLSLSPGKYQAIVYLENEVDQKKIGHTITFTIKK